VAGGYDEVVPWSGRGPTSIGEPKPDVVDIGAFGFADQATFTGYGNGTKAYDVFGGTSMATPVTAGAIALLIQEYRETHDGETPRPDLIKSILASTAADLDYDPFTQGSGRVDVYNAVAAAAEGRDARFPGTFYLQSMSSWDSARKLIESSWELNIGEASSDQPMGAANWFGGVVRAGSSISTSFNLFHAISPQVNSYVFQLIGSGSYENSTRGNVSWVTLPKEEIPAGTDLMKITLVYHFSDFANASTWEVKDSLVAQLYDLNQNGSLARITNAAPEGTTSELVVSRPMEKFSGVPKVRILFSGDTGSIPFEVVVRYYRRTPWNWVTILDIDESTFVASLRIPTTATPGVYAGLLTVRDRDSESIVPVSVVVPIVASGRYRGTAADGPYDNFVVYGAFDWGWRYEAGDWRTFAVVVTEGTHKIDISVIWSDSETDIQAHLTSPLGYLVASSDYPTTKNVNKGRFYPSTRTGESRQDISAGDATSGIYFLVLHNTLFGARAFTYPETFTVNVNFT
jgi:hypothetical protein